MPKISLSPATDYDRPWILEVSGNGVVNIRDKNAKTDRRRKSPDGSMYLPVFSTNTEDEARSLVVSHCKHTNDGSDLYKLNPSLFDPNANDVDRLNALNRVSSTFRQTYATMLSRETDNQ